MQTSNTNISPKDFPLSLTRYNKDSPTSIGGEMNCKQENERQWRAERNRYPPLTWGKSQSACCWHVRLCEITDCELKQCVFHTHQDISYLFCFVTVFFLYPFILPLSKNTKYTCHFYYNTQSLKVNVFILFSYYFMTAYFFPWDYTPSIIMLQFSSYYPYGA